ncbi:MAG: pentapeptide repeat-containing protein [Cyanobacteria bacterium P01_F01_bin.56]
MVVDQDQLVSRIRDVESWNQWRVYNPDISIHLPGVQLSGFDLSGINLSNSNLSRANFKGSILVGANFSKARLNNAYFNSADLAEATLKEAVVENARFSSAILDSACFAQASLIHADLSDAQLHKTDLSGTWLNHAKLARAVLYRACVKSSYLVKADLYKANLVDAKFSDSDLKEANLTEIDGDGTDFSRAILVNANLTRAQLLNAVFIEAQLTGACIQDWHVGSSTNLSKVDVKYIYHALATDQTTGERTYYDERRPCVGNYSPGEFETLFKQATDTIDLIFQEGIDWKAFFQSMQELKREYPGQEIGIQAIEKKPGEAFVVRIEVPENADKAAIESSAKELYETKLALVEQCYRAKLQAKDSIIAAYQQQNTSLMNITKTLAEKSPMPETPKYDLRGAQFSGGFAETVQGNQIGGPINNQAAATPSLAEAASEIQDLLKQLESTNPTATEADQTAYLNAMIPPTRRERFIGALKAAGDAAIDEVPYLPVLRALVEGWQQPNG